MATADNKHIKIWKNNNKEQLEIKMEKRRDFEDIDEREEGIIPFLR